MKTTSHYTLEEADLLRKVETAIEGVVRGNEGMEWQDDGKYVKRQKYVDNIVSRYCEDESDPPITRSWFRFGRTVVAAPSGPGTLGPNQNSPPLQNGLKNTSIEEMEDFLRSDDCHPKLTQKWWTDADVYDFLEVYYTHEAPAEFKSLYLGNLDLRRVFEETREDIASIRSSSSASKKDSVDYYEEVRTKAAQIQVELAATNDLADALGPLREIMNVIEDIYMQLAKKPPENLTGEDLTVIKNIDSVYDDHLWVLPASLMSKASAQGPNESWLTSRASSNIDDFNAKHEDELQALKQKADSQGLLPSVTDYDAPSDSIEHAIEGMMRIADKKSE